MSKTVLGENEEQAMIEALIAALGSAVHQTLTKGGEDGLDSACARRWLVSAAP